MEVDASQAFSASLALGAITEVVVHPSIADGLIGKPRTGIDDVRHRPSPRRPPRQRQRGRPPSCHSRSCGRRAPDRRGPGAAATAAVLAKGVITPGQRAIVLVTGEEHRSQRIARGPRTLVAPFPTDKSTESQRPAALWPFVVACYKRRRRAARVAADSNLPSRARALTTSMAANPAIPVLERPPAPARAFLETEDRQPRWAQHRSATKDRRCDRASLFLSG